MLVVTDQKCFCCWLKCFLSCRSWCECTKLSKKGNTDNCKMQSTATCNELQTVTVKPHCICYFQKQSVTQWTINQTALHTLECIAEDTRFHHFTEIFYIFLAYIEWILLLLFLQLHLHSPCSNLKLLAWSFAILGACSILYQERTKEDCEAGPLVDKWWEVNCWQ